MLVPDPY